MNLFRSKSNLFFIFFFQNRFEDGTIPYLSIVSLLVGFQTIEQLIPRRSMNRISQHCFNLAKYLYASLKELKYSNGRKVVHFYHDTDFMSIADQGGIVNFNVLQNDGSFVGYSEVQFVFLFGLNCYEIVLSRSCYAIFLLKFCLFACIYTDQWAVNI